jgi:hypothetical protein
MAFLVASSTPEKISDSDFKELETETTLSDEGEFKCRKFAPIAVEGVILMLFDINKMAEKCVKM